MDYQLNTRLNGNIAMTSSYHERASLQRDKTLYKFIWVQIYGAQNETYIEGWEKKTSNLLIYKRLCKI